MERIQNKSVSKYTYHTITLDDTGYSRPTATEFPRQHGGCTGENAMYRVRSKHPGNEMGSWKHGCSEVRMNNTGPPDWQERDTEGLSEGIAISLHNHIHRSPRSQLASIYGWAVGPKASFSYLVDWEPPLAKQAHKTVRYAIFWYS